MIVIRNLSYWSQSNCEIISIGGDGVDFGLFVVEKMKLFFIEVVLQIIFLSIIQAGFHTAVFRFTYCLFAGEIDYLRQEIALWLYFHDAGYHCGGPMIGLELICLR